MSFPYLTWIIFLPLVGAIIIALFGGGRDKLIKYLAAIFTIVPFILALVLFGIFNRTAIGDGGPGVAGLPPVAAAPLLPACDPPGRMGRGSC